eukprot:scaffold138008_cov31-Tisochrysis_lutea.AAC.4
MPGNPKAEADLSVIASADSSAGQGWAHRPARPISPNESGSSDIRSVAAAPMAFAPALNVSLA